MSRTPAQQDALEQLWAITDSSSDAARAREERILRDNNWDVQRSIEQIFTGATSPPAAPSVHKPETEGSGYATGVGGDDDLGDLAMRPIPPGGRRISGHNARPSRPGSAGLGLWETFAWPFTIVASILTGTWYFFIRTFVPLSLLPHLPRFLLPPAHAGPPRGPRDPTTASLRFVRELETLTGSSATAGTLPDLWVGPYREFLTEVRKAGRVGAVILVCGEHEDDYEFKHDVVADPELVKCFKDNDIMVWAADISSREGYMVSQTLLTTTYPSITFASMLPTAGSSGSATAGRLSILTTLQGPPSTETSTSNIIQTITTAILPRTNAYLARLRRERLSLEEARHVREEQDRALRAAEAADREKLHAARAAAELERVQRERAEREEERKQKELADRAVWRRYARKHLLPPSSGPIRVALRTPISAERHVWNFVPGGSTLPLFVFAETRLIPAADLAENDPDTPPAGYDHAWGFRLVTSFPRKEIELVESGGEAIWEDVKKCGGALFAEKAQGGDWGESERGSESSDDEVVSDSD